MLSECDHIVQLQVGIDQYKDIIKKLEEQIKAIEMPDRQLELDESEEVLFKFNEIEMAKAQIIEWEAEIKQRIEESKIEYTFEEWLDGKDLSEDKSVQPKFLKAIVMKPGEKHTESEWVYLFEQYLLNGKNANIG